MKNVRLDAVKQDIREIHFDYTDQQRMIVSLKTKNDIVSQVRAPAVLFAQSKNRLRAVSRLDEDITHDTIDNDQSYE